MIIIWLGYIVNNGILLILVVLVCFKVMYCFYLECRYNNDYL